MKRSRLLHVVGMACLAWRMMGGLAPGLHAEDWMPGQVSSSPTIPWAPEGAMLTAPENPATLAKQLSLDVSRPLTLSQLMDIGLRRSPATKQAWENARASAAALGASQSGYYPTVSLGVSGSYQKQTSSEGPSQPTTSDFTYGPQLGMTWLLLDFGTRAAGVDMARESLRAANFQFNAAMQQLVLNIQMAYYQYDAALSLVAAALQAEKLADATLEAAEIRVRTGLANEISLLQSRQAQAKSVYSLENARGTLKTAQAQLAQAMGLPAHFPLEVASADHETPLQALNTGVEQLIGDAVKARPDLAQSFALLKSSEAAVRQAEADYWPTLTASGNASKTFYETRYRPKGSNGVNHFNGSANDYQAGLAINVDLFDGLYKVNLARQARSQAAAARAALQNAELLAISDVFISYYQYKTAEKGVTHGQDLVATSQKALEAVQIGQKNGLNSMLDLLNAQSNLAAGQAALVQSRAALLLASAQMAYATGALLPQPPQARADVPKTEPSKEEEK